MAQRTRLIGSSADLPDAGRGLKFTVMDRAGVEQPAFAIRYQGRVYAYLNQCAHVPVELDWGNAEFFDYSKLYLLCSTHGALYDPRTGACRGGRCNGRGLRPLSVVEENQHIYLVEEES